jgi:hypothetical protein
MPTVGLNKNLFGHNYPQQNFKKSQQGGKLLKASGHENMAHCA